RHAEPAPVVYDFQWNPSEAPGGAWQPDARTYALAIAEADAARSDVVIDLPERLQNALASGDASAWQLWTAVKPYLDSSTTAPLGEIRPVANLGAIVEDPQASYEAINLMARHNLAFEAVRPVDITAERLADWNSVVVFCSLNKDVIALLGDFAAKGGI